MSQTAVEALERLRALGSPEAAALAARNFKTGPGQYGEGDVFLGIRVPALRKLAREFRELDDGEVLSLLRSEYHEARLLALLIMALAASKGDQASKRRAYDLYLANTRSVNNWDLVDASAREIVGGYLHDKDRGPLHLLAGSESLWERRIAIIATHHFIARHDYADTLRLSEVLLADPHDLIHKAAGWMLREVGKRDRAALEGFLAVHQRAIPRTMLRYSIEKFPTEVRVGYLKGIIARGRAAGPGTVGIRDMRQSILVGRTFRRSNVKTDEAASTFTSGPTPNTVSTSDGKVLTVPDGWVLLPPGDAGLTRRVKAAGDHWVVQEKVGRRRFSRGIWAAAATIERIRAKLDAERSTEGYARKQDAATRRRETVQAEYVEDFHRAVLAFLSFHPAHADLAGRLARAVADQATPVGSGTVARTGRIPVEERAEAAVIAWMRHRTTGYDGMAIPRVKGKRREVRRMLARRSQELLARYRRGEPIGEDCPLRRALAVEDRGGRKVGGTGDGDAGT